MSARQTQPLAPSWAPIATTVAVLVTGTIAGLVWHSDKLPPADAWALREFEAQSDGVFRTARVISVGLASLAIGGALTVAVLDWVVLRWRNAALLSLAAPALTFVVEKVLKQSVARRAPGSLVFHYPSGHVAITTAAVLSLVLVMRSARAGPGARVVVVAASLYVVAIAIARQVDKAHLLSDVIGGVATGVAVTLTAALLLDSRLLNPVADLSGSSRRSQPGGRDTGAPSDWARR